MIPLTLFSIRSNHYARPQFFLSSDLDPETRLWEFLAWRRGEMISTEQIGRIEDASGWEPVRVHAWAIRVMERFQGEISELLTAGRA